MKTTILGILTIIGAFASAAIQYLKTGTIDIAPLIPAVTAGFGLIKAEDSYR
jgi:hypothetical protein